MNQQKPPKQAEDDFKKTLQRMLKTPPQPHEPSDKKKKSPARKKPKLRR